MSLSFRGPHAYMDHQIHRIGLSKVLLAVLDVELGFNCISNSCLML